MKKLNFLKYGLTALMMAFAMTLCYSCSSDDDEQNNNQEVNPPSNGESGTINGHAYVELAGIKWATENLSNNSYRCGNDDTYGDYFRQNDGSAKNAAASWGSEGKYKWTLPTTDQWQALLNECNWTWTENYNNMLGYIVSDKTDSSKSIFLPIAGVYYDTLRNRAFAGYYWASESESMLFLFNRSKQFMTIYDPGCGMSVRPVAVAK